MSCAWPCVTVNVGRIFFPSQSLTDVREQAPQTARPPRAVDRKALAAMTRSSSTQASRNGFVSLLRSGVVPPILGVAIFVGEAV